MKTFKAGNKQQETTTKQLLDDTFNQIKGWMDKMQLKLNLVKYLGEVLDNTLNFESHVSLNVQKAMANFIKIKSMHRYITREACTTLVILLCMSHLDYSNALLHGLPRKPSKDTK